MKYFICIPALSILLLGAAHAESSNIEKYKQAYIELITPMVKERFSEALAKEEDPEAKLAFVANGLADCQIETISTYPQKYQDASINLVAEGKDFGETSKQVDEMIQTDIESGAVTEEELQVLIKKATSKYAICTKVLEKRLENTPTLPK